MKILIVDDDEILGQVMSRAFKRYGHESSLVTTEEQALEKAAAEIFDGAVLDLRLESGSGINLIDPLKKLMPEINIIMLTGYSSIATAVQAVKLGARDYLCKPATAEEIINKMFSGKEGVEPEITESPPSVERLEWEHIQKILMEHNGNISATARALGMHRRTLQRKLQKRPAGS